MGGQLTNCMQSPRFVLAFTLTFSALATNCHAQCCSLNPPPSSYQFYSGLDIHSVANTGLPSDSVYAVADYNHDGKPDVFLYDQAGLLINDVAGTFTNANMTLPPAFPTGGGVNKVAWADVDGDGLLDLITSSTGPAGENGIANVGGVAVYPGYSDGSFHLTPSFTAYTGALSTGVFAVDVNGDGKLDLIVSTQPDPNTGTPGGTFVFLNQGSGSFKAAPSMTTVTAVLTTGDFNGDGKTDLVAVLLGANSQSVTRVMIGKGDGTFNLGAVLTSQASGAATVGDFNRDGETDIALGISTNAIVLLGDGKGNFRKSASLNPGSGDPSVSAAMQAIVTGDLNRDGFADIAVVLGNRIATYFGDGTGGFTFNRIYNGAMEGAVLADFTGDGNLDMLTGGSHLYLGNSNGIFSAAVTAFPDFSTSPHDTFSIVTADLNGDKIPDIAMVSTNLTSPPTGGFVTIQLGTGKGYFGAPHSYAIQQQAGTIAAGDLNGDGTIDLVVTRSGAYYSLNTPHPVDTEVLLGHGDGTFDAAKGYTVVGAPSQSQYTNSAFLADENGDKKLDLIGDWGVALGNGDGTFQAPIAFPGGIVNIRSIAAGDMNGDGILDLVINGPSANGSAWSLIGLGTGHFRIASANVAPLGHANVLADLNHDGKVDLISTAGSAVTVSLGKGDGTFGPQVVYSTKFSNGTALVVADFNRDGKPDVAVAVQSGSAGLSTGIQVMRGNGDGTLLGPDPFHLDGYDPSLAYSEGLVGADFGEVLIPIDVNGDGFPDLVDITGAGVERLINTRRH